MPHLCVWPLVVPCVNWEDVVCRAAVVRRKSDVDSRPWRRSKQDECKMICAGVSSWKYLKKIPLETLWLVITILFCTSFSVSHVQYGETGQYLFCVLSYLPSVGAVPLSPHITVDYGICCVLCSCLIIVCLICLCTICSFSTLILLVGSFDL